MEVQEMKSQLYIWNKTNLYWINHKGWEWQKNKNGLQ